MPNNCSRNQRNNPYLIEGWAVDFHRSKAGIAWRWRTELTLIAATAGRLLPARGGHHRPVGAHHPRRPHHGRAGHPALAPVPQAARLVPDLPAPAPAGLLRGPAAHPRRTAPAHLVDPPDQGRGTRLRSLCRAGICADDFDAYKAEIGAACYAREARVIRNKKWSHLVTIDIIRHDPLTADVIIPSRIIPPDPAGTR